MKLTKEKLKQIIREEIDIILEVPIRDITPVGPSWGTGRGGFKPLDQRILSSPRAIEKIRKQWEKDARKRGRSGLTEYQKILTLLAYNLMPSKGKTGTAKATNVTTTRNIRKLLVCTRRASPN